VEREGVQRGREGGREGVRCEQQIVGALVVGWSGSPVPSCFMALSLSGKTVQPCRQLCSGGCGGERGEEEEERKSTSRRGGEEENKESR